VSAEIAQEVARHLGVKPTEGPVRPWLDALLAVLATAHELPTPVVADLVARARPRWGARTVDDGAAYVELWSALATRFPVPALVAAYADVLYLVGPVDRAMEALQALFAAVRREPAIFVEYAGDFSELAEKLGAQRDYALAKVTFYAHLVDRGEMEESELRDAVRELLDAHGTDPTVRPALRRIGHRSLQRIVDSVC
jgi:hypothetical protein